MKCACEKYELKMKKGRWGHEKPEVIIEGGGTIYHGSRACFDITKKDDVIATRFDDDPLNKK